ncbi:MAG: transcription-repair coupling factor [Clostridiales bacterium]|nr:transcription-repair coupling factor [Clostridiales bacterium]
MIRHLLGQNSNLKILLNTVNENKKISVINCSEGEIIGILDEINRPKLFVVPTNDEAEKYIKKFEALSYRVNACTSIPDVFLNDYSTSHIEYVNFIKNISNPSYDIHIATPEILLLDVPNNVVRNNQLIDVEIDKVIDIEELQKKLALLGYEKVTNVSGGGQFASRGEILDLVPMGKSEGYRIIFDYDVVAKIQQLDNEYIQPISNMDNLSIYSNSYIDVDLSKIQFSKNDGVVKKIYDNYLEFNKTYNSLWFLQFSSQPLVKLIDVLDSEMLVVFSDVKQIYDVSKSIIEEYNQKIKEGKENKLLLDVHRNPLNIDNLTSKENRAIIGFQYINNANKIFSPNAVFSFKSMPNIEYGENYESLIIDLQNYNKIAYTTLLFITEDNYDIVYARLVNKTNINICKTIFDAQKGVVNIFKKEYNNSFNLFEDKIAVIGSNAVGKKAKNIKIINTAVDALSDTELPKEDEYVVHKIHGIGKCKGIQTLQLTSGIKKDYIVVEYKNEDKLYLPIENVDSITKYVGDGENPTLNKLGGVEFKKVKDRVKASVKDIAKDLIAIYKARQSAQGYKYSADDEIQAEFEENCPYELTSDQAVVISDIKKEMVAGKLIDRLICGDVGFGKTEVAIRIAFKTILCNKQVAVLCPTTILSEQHFNTFNTRMGNYGVNIAVLNRFKTASEVQNIINDFNDNKINIIIGTHKLLNKAINFANLGLLVIDEEQKFGVEHKEKIKKLKTGINVLTLSATPIPRTLHLSLNGIRDISTIQTPPSNKITTQVSVVEYNDNAIKLAIDREISRNGQVLIIYNKVESIDAVAHYISKLLDNKYAIDVAHGQMSANILEDKIIKVYNGKTQILISTTLIENGVDLPNANTLIILDADKLGLSQLYQLKGRVGRGSRESYAFFMYRGDLTDVAYKRLKAISEFTAMGSGFKIAMRDMELRGVGNIFGGQQHGHMLKIGYSMYMAILNNVIDELENNTPNNKLYQEIRIDTDFPTTIPISSNMTTNQKISLYTKIANISSLDELNSVQNKLKDLFEIVPEYLINLCKFALIKNKLYTYSATKLVVRKDDVHIDFGNEADIKTISTLINDNVKIDVSLNLRVNITGIDRLNILDYLIKLLN